MKIHYLSASTLPSLDANSVHVIKMCQAFSDHGHEVSLLGHSSSKSKTKIFDYYDVDDRFELVLCRDPKVRRLRGLTRVLHVSSSLRRGGLPDLFYARDEWSLAYIAGRSIPFIFEAHGLPSSKLRHLLIERLMLSPNMARVVFISQALSAEFIKIFPNLDTAKILVAPDSANVPKKTPRPVLLWPGRENSLQVGYVGSLYHGRGIDLIQKMAALLPEVDFHLVGGKEKLINQYKINTDLPNVKYHGHVPHKSVPSYFTRFDILLAPYQPDVTLASGAKTGSWMSPLKAFEYMTTGKPIVVSDLPVLREIFENNSTALMVRHDDVNAWVSAVQTLGDDGELRMRLGTNALEKVKINSWTKRAELVLEGLP